MTTHGDSSEREVPHDEPAGEPADLLARLVHSSVDGIVAFDRDCRYTVWNPAMERISGIPASETLGRRAFDIFPFLEEIGEDTYFHAALDGRTVVARDRPFTIPSTGRRGFFEGHYSPLLDRQGEVIGGLGIIRDITERKALEAESLHSQKLESLGRLAGGIAHDFNNLLTVIVSAVEVAREALPPRHAAVEHLDLVTSTSSRAAGLTGRLLSFARRQPVEARPLDLSRLVEDLIPLLRRLLAEDVEVRLQLEPNPWLVKADRGQMEQVLVNLALNAREAMPAGGVLRLETRNSTKEDGTETVHLTVRDDGGGIDADSLPLVFEPFFTTKGEGRGFGLASSYGIVAQVGGRMSVESEPNRGTTFSIELPRTHEPAPRDDPGRGDGVSARGNETVLVVEDEPSVRHLLVGGFRRQGYRVLEARDGQEALDVLRSEPGSIDVLVTDAVMPRMGGLELVRRVRELRPRTRPLLLSGHVQETDHDSDLASVPRMRKPATPREVVRRVREMLDG